MIELVEDDGPHDGEDVHFGVGQRRAKSSAPNRGPGVKIAAGVVGVLALGGAAMAFSRDDAPTGEQASVTTIPDPTNSPRTNSPQITTPPISLPTDFDPIELNPLPTVAPTTTLFDSGAGQIFPTDTPLGLYLATGESSSDVLRLDLATGTVAKVDDTTGRMFAVLTGPEGPVFIDESFVGSGAWFVVTSPDGTVWAPDQNGNFLIQFNTAGERVRTASPPPGSIFGANIVGVLADGRPVVLGPDARAYAINPDDTYERLGEGFVSSVQTGGYWETVCDTTGFCNVVIHGVGQTPFTINSADGKQTFAISLSPSGRFAFVFVGEALSVIDLTTGVRTDVPNAGVTGGFYGPFGQQQTILWSGEADQFAVYSGSDNLAVYDTTTGELRTIEIPPGEYNPVLLGIAP